MRLRVLSYNIHRAIGVDRRFRPERIARILEAHDPDVVLLQEVDEGVPRSREMNLARELAGWLGYRHLAIGHNVTLRKGRYGNATLSRYPIQRERNIDLTVGPRKRRGCQHTRIALAGASGRRHPLEVFNLHLGLSARERQHQVGMLTRSREFAALAPDVACLVGGDFNDWRSQLEPIFLDRLAFRSATGGDRRRERAVPTFPSFFPQGSLDRIYYRGPLRLLAGRRCRLSLSRVASDHLPIVVDFDLA
jgi:endonuclease/exonuclease/phosphatase family metal-dependent hydrolase